MDKTCTKCEESKPLERFGPSRRSRDGLNWWCKECMSAAQRASYRRHIESARERKRVAVWAKNQDPAERERKRERDRAAYRRNPETWKAGAARRRARQQAASVYEFTVRDWLRIVERQRGECHYCGNRTVLTKEHLIPLCRGGSHSVGNIVAACMDCNARKHDKTRSEFIAWRRRMAVA